VISKNQVSNAEALFSTLKASNQSGRSITVRYYLGTGDFDTQSGKPIFVVSELVYDGRTFRGTSSASIAAMVEGGKGKPAPTLARGVALYGMGRFDEALAALEQALANDQLPVKLRALALETRERTQAGHGSRQAVHRRARRLHGMEGIGSQRRRRGLCARAGAG
jgi:tetratricopeptide (TPR) repeat protein